MQNIIIRNATIDDVEKIEGWQTAYRGIIDDDFLDADCEISSLYVTSKLKRNGIGRKLMQYVIELLKKEGKTKMILGCLKENYPSRAFYDKMGGKIIDYDEIEFGDKKYGLAMYEYDIVNM